VKVVKVAGATDAKAKVLAGNHSDTEEEKRP
jgi:hypothetical protein